MTDNNNCNCVSSTQILIPVALIALVLFLSLAFQTISIPIPFTHMFVLHQSMNSFMTPFVAALLGLPDVNFQALAGIWPELHGLEPGAVEQLEIDAQYAGYLARQEADILAFRRDESLNLPDELDYSAVCGLSAEAVQKLAAIRPATLGQASRIDGVTPAALTLVLAHVKSARHAA